MQHFSRPRHFFAFSVLGVGSLATLAHAGNPAAQAVRVHAGTQPNGHLGNSVSPAGDVNGDGFRDYIAGVPGKNKALVHSGLTGEILFDLVGEADCDQFGYSVASAGDVNGDGFDDVIIGDPELFIGCMPQGGAMVYSGFDGSLLLFPPGITGFERFGHSVAGAGDVDGDGFDDIVIGAPWRDPACLPQSGGINVYSGYNGGPIFDTVGNAGWQLGSTVIGMGDVNNDGHADIAASAPGAGKVFIYDAYNNSTLRTFTGPAGSKFGQSIANIGDVDGDGVNEIAVGAPYTALPWLPGKVFIYSGSSGALIKTWVGQTGGDAFGYTVAGAGDVNGDGFDDVAVGSPWAHTDSQSTGRVEIRNGQSGQLIKVINASASFSNYAASIGGLGDLNGDGMSDFIVGAPRAGSAEQGSAFVYPGSQNSLALESTDVLAPPGTPTALLSADLNKDGRNDVISVNTAADSISIFLTAEDGAFLAPVNKAAGDGPNSVAAGDFDMDGDLDLAVLAAKDKTILLFRNNGSGGMAKKGSLKTGKKPVALKAADLNGDNRADLVLAYQGDDQIAIFKNNASGQFEKIFKKAKKISVGDAPAQIEIAALNIDTLPDLLVFNKNSQNVSILSNNGNNSFTSKPAVAAAGASQIVAADLNDDSIIDLGWLSAAGEMTWRTGMGHGLFLATNSVGLDATSSAVLATDVDFDGSLDLVSPRASDGSLIVLFNDGAGQFSAGLAVQGALMPKAITSGDLDSDGDADFITIDGNDGTLVVHRNLWFN